MNTTVWKPEEAQRWSACVASMRVSERRHRRWGNWNGAMAVFYPLLATAQVVEGNWLAPVVNLLICWMMYRFYLSARRWQREWRDCVHHGERMLHETGERACWHSEQLEAILDGMKARRL